MKRILFFILIFGSHLAAAYELQGKVVKVADGDTLTLLTPDNRQHKIRLDQIDAPESDQPWGARSKEALIELVANKTITVTVSGKDRYGRLIGTPFLETVDICKEQIKTGNAWVYVQYAKDPQLKKIEADAKQSKVGLWALPENQRIEPWVFRRKK
jgi:endonuclease YncB( thermonuclease family)